MAKTKRKWICLNWDDSGCLRAQDIPYDSTSSIKTKIETLDVNNSVTIPFTWDDVDEFTKELELEHNLNKLFVHLSIYNNVNELVITSCKLINENTISVDFSDLEEPITGTWNALIIS